MKPTTSERQGRWPTTFRRDVARSGQALVLGALMMTVLVAMTGLAVDTGVWLVAKARLQRAVDAATLSVVLDRPTPAQTNGAGASCPGVSPAPVATDRARDVVLNQGIPDNQLTCVLTSVPRSNQLLVSATQLVPTAFAKVIGINEATIGAQATADINTYVEIPVSPICGGTVSGSGSSEVCDGGIGDSTMDQFGTQRNWSNGDSYTNTGSPFYNGPDGLPVLPEGYLYRVHVEAGYTGALDIQVFDPDGFNKRNPQRYLNPCPPAIVGDPCDTIENPTYYALNDHRDGSGSAIPGGGSNNVDMPSIAQNYFASGLHLFWRVDECNGGGGQTCRQDAAMVPIEFTLWYLDPDAMDPLAPLPGERTDIERVVFRPSSVGSISCGTAGSGRPSETTPTTIPCTTVTYTCTSDVNGNVSDSSCPDLRWPRLFHIANVASYPARSDGSRSFFIYVRALGSTNTENVYHLRSGPPPGDTDQRGCQRSGVGGRGNFEDVNNQASCQWVNGRGANANTKVFARRSMPTNVMQAGGSVPYIVWLGYIPRTAAGQTLRLRNYDLDRPAGACPPTSSSNAVNYIAYFPSSGRRSTLMTACGSGGTVWQEDLWSAPAWDGTTSDTFWGSDEGFWLYADVFQKSGIFWDTAVWEVIFNRARLIR
ncbi:MAG: hypothetical protein IT340_13010 [Chloroflexi bacterium]|nr:hypothetical protein [Chloroflexota bacterium]